MENIHLTIGIGSALKSITYFTTINEQDCQDIQIKEIYMIKKERVIEWRLTNTDTYLQYDLYYPRTVMIKVNKFTTKKTRKKAISLLNAIKIKPLMDYSKVIDIKFNPYFPDSRCMAQKRVAVKNNILIESLQIMYMIEANI